jgi:hypothetical protein
LELLRDNEVNTVNSKRRFEKRLASEKGNNNKPFFAYIKKKTKSKSLVGPLKDKNEEVVTGD